MPVKLSERNDNKMISQKMQDAINLQITKEFYSSYLYLSMAAYLEEQSLTGFAKWMRVQAQEEHAHALIFFNHLLDRDGQVKLGALDAPPHEFASPLDVYERTLEHEHMITASIHALVDLAIEERDHAARNLLAWFVDEQVEEEANDKGIIARLKQIGGDGNGLFVLNNELGARVFVVPTPLVGKI